jgi:hypothetical protein
VPAGGANAAVASVRLCRWNRSQSCASQVGWGRRLLLPRAPLRRAGQCCMHHIRRAPPAIRARTAALHRRALHRASPYCTVCALLQTATPWLLRMRSVASPSGGFSTPNRGASAWSHGAGWQRMQPPSAPSLATPRSRSGSPSTPLVQLGAVSETTARFAKCYNGGGRCSQVRGTMVLSIFGIFDDCAYSTCSRCTLTPGHPLAQARLAAS